MVSQPLQQLRRCLSSISSECLQRFLDGVLIYAASNGRIDLLALLWDYGYDLGRHVREMDGWATTTAMGEALFCKDIAFCKRLIELGDNLTTTPRSRLGIMKDEYSVETWVLHDGMMPYETSTIFLAAKFLPNLIRSELPNLAPSLAESLLPVAVQAGMDIPEISELISGGADINGIDGRLSTALHYAISREDVSLTQYLLDNGASPDGRSSESAVPVHTDLDSAQVWPLSFLLTPLVLAVQLNNSVLCEILIKAQANVNLSMKDKLPGFFESDMADLCESYFSFLHFNFASYIEDGEAEIRSDEDDMCLYFLGTESARWCNLWTAIEVAAADGLTEILELLLQNGADLQMDYTSSPLVLAAGLGEVKDVELLLDYGADPQHIANDGCEFSALQVACLRGDAEIVSLLIEAGASIDDPDTEGPTELQCAATRGNLDIARDLLQRGADPDAVPDAYRGLTALQGAVFCGCEEVVDTLLRYGANINALPGTERHHTALGTAIVNDRFDIFRKLYDIAGDHAIEWDGSHNLETLLSVAAGASRSDYLLFLLGLRSDLDRLLQNGCTLAEDAILNAASRLKGAHMLFLLDKATQFSPGVLTRALNSLSGRMFRTLDVVIALLERGAGVCRQKDGGKPLVLSTKSLKIMQVLVARGADVNEPPQESDDSQSTVLQGAVRRRDITMVKFLLGKGANINAPPEATKYGRTALQKASEWGDMAILQLLLDHGADVNAPPAETGGVTALQAASIGGYLGIAEILIQAGADIGAPASSEEGRTALNGAAEHGRLDLVKLLLDNYRLKDGESFSQLCDEAVGYAKRELHWGVVELLEKYQRPPNLSP
ncbi:hypothetical protein LTS17_000367 [Exophiala oligosperma]